MENRHEHNAVSDAAARRIADALCKLGGFLSRCNCPDDSGDCQWCHIYYGALAGDITEADMALPATE